MTRAACLTLCLLLFGCAVVDRSDTREYLDGITAATITVSVRPWVFARERPDVAVNVRDYLSVYSAEVNRSGEHRTYLVVRAWSTVGGNQQLPDSGARLDIAADDRLFSMAALAAEPRTIGIGEPIVSARSRSERVWYFPLQPEARAYIAAARNVSVELRAADFRAKYGIWRAIDESNQRPRT